MNTNFFLSWFKKKIKKIVLTLLIIIMFLKHQIGILQFLKDHVKMKTGLMSAEN